MGQMFVVFIGLFISLSVYSQKNLPSEAQKIDTTIQAVMQCISVKKGEEVNWNRFRNLFLSTARFNFFTYDKDGNQVFINKTLEEFISDAQYGKYEFHEIQLGANISIYGSVAHAFQGYHFKINGGQMERKGINSIQLVKQDDRWWIANISWQPETDELKYPKALKDLIMFY